MSKSTLLTPQSKDSLREEIDKLLSEISILQGIYTDPEDENNNKTKPLGKTTSAAQGEKPKSKLEFKRSKPKVSTITVPLPSDYNQQKRPQSPIHPEAKPEDESLKSPYLRCLMDVLKIDGHNQTELAKSQQEIVKQFQYMTGMHRPSTPPMTKESVEAEYSNFVSQTNKNGRPTTARSNATFLRAQALAELKRPTLSQAKLMFPVKTEKTVLPKPKAKKSPSISSTQKFVNAPQLLSSLSSYAPHPQKPLVLDSEDLTFVFGSEPKNERRYSEEIKHYYNWKAFCLVKRYGNNPEKLKEKLKTMEEDFAHLNMDLPVVPPTTPTTIGIMEENEDEARKSLSTPPKKTKKKLNKSVQKFDSKKALPLTRGPPKTKAKSQLKDCVTVRKCASHEHRVNRDQHVNRVQSAGICNWNQRMDMAPSWELTGLVKLATVFVPVDEDQLFEQQQINQINSKSKFKSRFTIRDEKLEKLRLLQ